ncbi:MAG: NTP transferase domain-containing protein [Myxococcaceae bacterium]|nr:NTP transferase domain-containing protein [Myxococcaceae bacterium]
MTAKEELTLALLAGGAGARLGGVEKGHLQFRGQSFAQTLHGALGVHCARTVVVSPRPQVWPGWDVAADVEPGHGAPGALVTALLAARTRWVLVVAVDLPTVQWDHVSPLVGAAVQGDGACYRWDGRLEGLLGVYRAALGPPWQARLGENPSVQALIRTAAVSALDAPPAMAQVLRSVNTPDALQALLKNG